jgi:hypothetical protein
LDFRNGILFSKAVQFAAASRGGATSAGPLLQKDAAYNSDNEKRRTLLVIAMRRFFTGWQQRIRNGGTDFRLTKVGEIEDRTVFTFLKPASFDERPYVCSDFLIREIGKRAVNEIDFQGTALVSACEFFTDPVNNIGVQITYSHQLSWCFKCFKK